MAADRAIISDLICLGDAPKNEDSKPKEQTVPERVRRAVWDMLNADDADACSGSPGGLARMMTVTVVVIKYQKFGSTTWENPGLTRDDTALQGGERNGTSKQQKQMVECTYLGGVISADPNIFNAIERRPYQRCVGSSQIVGFHIPRFTHCSAIARIQIRKPKVVEAMPYAYALWTLHPTDVF